MRTRFTRIMATSAFGLLLTVAGAGTALAGDATVSTAEHEPYGDHLVDGKGMSLYLFEADEGGMSSCYDACATAWPPLMTSGAPQAAGKAKHSLLGTVKRKDGSMQVTYGGWPVYYFIKDRAAGDTKGQGIDGFGAEWYLVGPDGKTVEKEKQEKKSTY